MIREETKKVTSFIFTSKEWSSFWKRLHQEEKKMHEFLISQGFLFIPPDMYLKDENDLSPP